MLLNKNILAIGIVFLFVCSAFIPMSLGVNTRITDTREQPSTFSRGNTLYVGGSGDGNYSQIQDAINDSVDGDTVFVYNGTYYENVVVDKSIQLIGEDKNTTIIDADLFGHVVKIKADEVVLSGFTIQNSGRGGDMCAYSGIDVFSSNWNQIFENIIKNNNHGIYLSGSNNTIGSNKIIHNIRYGIFIVSGNNNFITNNYIAHNAVNGIVDHIWNDGNIATWNVIADNGIWGILQLDSVCVYHHNDFLFNRYNAEVKNDDEGNIWDDGSEGNFWSDWETNPGYPDVYIIPSDFSEEIDYYPSVIPYMDSLVVALPYCFYALVDEPINFSADIFVLDIYSVSWFWDFGDGNTSDEVYPSHSYDSTGQYHITVTVTDNQGRSDTSKSEAYIGRAPEKPTITGPTRGKSGVKYKYTISTVDPDGDDVYYWFYPGYGMVIDDVYFGPYASGEEFTLNISFPEGTFWIRAQAFDTANLWSPEATLEITMPRNKIATNNLILRFLEQFPILNRLIYLTK